MHKLYMMFLRRLGRDLINVSWYEIYIGPKASLKHKARSLISFDREIILAQKMFDMAASQPNQPHGDLNDMSSNPKFVHLNGQLYVSAQALAGMYNFNYRGGRELSPGVKGEGQSGWFEHNISGPGYKCSEYASEVVVKQDDSAVIGPLKYKVELDTSDIDALLEKLRSLIAETKLGKDIAATLCETTSSREPAFSLLNNGTIIINQAAVDGGHVPLPDSAE